MNTDISCHPAEAGWCRPVTVILGQKKTAAARLQPSGNYQGGLWPSGLTFD